MAETLNAKLASSDDRTDENAVQAVTRSLKSLGLDTPVVAKAGELEEEQYHKGLAKELGTVLLGRTPGAANTSTAPMAVGDPQREIIGLDQVWCLWNRARGVGMSFRNYVSLPATTTDSPPATLHCSFGIATGFT